MRVRGKRHVRTPLIKGIVGIHRENVLPVIRDYIDDADGFGHTSCLLVES